MSLAAELARLVSINWYGKNATDIIQRIAKFKGKAEGEIEHRLHLNAVNVNDVLIDKGYDAPAKLLFQLADDNYLYPQFIFEAESVAEEAPATDSLKNKMAENASNIQAKKKLSETEKNKTKLTKKPDVKSPAKASIMPAAERKAILEKIKARKLAAKQLEEKTAKPDVVKKPMPARPVDSQTEKPPVAAAKKNPVIGKPLSAAIKEFQLMVAQAKPAHDLIEHAVKTCLLCGVQRSVFVVKVPKKDLLFSRYMAQVSDDIKMKDLKIPINKPHVFKLLMEKSRALFLNESNSNKYWRFIPEPVKLTIGVRYFFAMSVFVNNHAMGLMYVDKVKGELTQAEFIQFQGVCRMLSKGIVQSTHNKKDKAEK